MGYPELFPPFVSWKFKTWCKTYGGNLWKGSGVADR